MAQTNGHNGHTGGSAVLDPPPLPTPQPDTTATIVAAIAGGAGLVPKLAEVLGAMSRIKKNGSHPQGWKFSTESDVADMVRPELAERGIMMLPQLRNHIQEVTGRTGKGADIIRHTVDVDYLITDGENTIVIPWRGQADDSSDKGLAKALTAAQKYMLIRLFQLSSGDDPDLHDVDADREPRSNSAPAKAKSRGTSRDEVVAERQEVAQARAVALGIEDFGGFFGGLGVDHPSKLGSDAVWKGVDAELTRREDAARSDAAPPEPAQDAPAAPDAAETPQEAPKAGTPPLSAAAHAAGVTRRAELNGMGLPPAQVSALLIALGFVDTLHVDHIWEAAKDAVTAEAAKLPAPDGASE